VVPALALAACGDGGGGGAGGTSRVELSLASPGDGTVVRAAIVEVRGTVRPSGAAVEVAGRAAAVRGGQFDAVVPLSVGANVIDVAADAPGARPAVLALRVQRDDRVTVPQLVGDDPDVVQAHLEDLGLKVRSQRGGGFFDPIIPEAKRVCSLSPGPGSRVEPGTRVKMVWARHC
jgi:hypothetical protein